MGATVTFPAVWLGSWGPGVGAWWLLTHCLYTVWNIKFKNKYHTVRFTLTWRTISKAAWCSLAYKGSPLTPLDIYVKLKLLAWTNRADVQREDEDDEEAQIPGKQCAEQDHTLLLFKVSIPVQEEKSQKKDNDYLDGQRRPAHSAPRPCAAKTPGGKKFRRCLNVIMFTAWLLQAHYDFSHNSGLWQKPVWRLGSLKDSFVFLQQTKNCACMRCVLDLKLYNCEVMTL